MNKEQFSSQAEALAESILNAAGSSLKSYTMPKTRNAIFQAATNAIKNAGDEDNEHSGETRYVRSAAFFEEDMRDEVFVAKTVRAFSDTLNKDADSRNKKVRFFHIKVTAFLADK